VLDAVGDTDDAVNGYAVAALPSADPTSAKALWGGLAGRLLSINATGNTEKKSY